MMYVCAAQETDGNGAGAAAASNGLEPLNGLDK